MVVLLLYINLMSIVPCVIDLYICVHAIKLFNINDHFKHYLVPHTIHWLYNTVMVQPDDGQVMAEKCSWYVCNTWLYNIFVFWLYLLIFDICGTHKNVGFSTFLQSIMIGRTVLEVYRQLGVKHLLLSFATLDYIICL
jgi:hypothetical protein